MKVQPFRTLALSSDGTTGVVASSEHAKNEGGRSRSSDLQIGHCGADTGPLARMPGRLRSDSEKRNRHIAALHSQEMIFHDISSNAARIA